MDKRPHIRPYLYGMLAGFGAISLSILFFFLIYRFQGFGDAISTLISILMPFIYGWVIAYLLKPICNSVERFFNRHLPGGLRRLSGGLAVAASLLFGFLIVYALLLMIIPQLITSIVTLSSSMQSKLDQLVAWLSGIFADNEVITNFIEEAYDTLSETFLNWVRNTLLPSMQDIVSGVGLGVWNTIIVLKNILIGLVVAIYMLANRKKFSRQSKMVLYSVFNTHWADLILDEIRYADRMFGGFINGKLLDSAIIGVLCYVVCLIAKMPSALLVSVIVGVTNVIPFFGPFIGAVPATLLILIEDPIKAIWFVLIVLVLQQVDGNIIGPKILGNTTGLSSFWVLFSILLFGGLWGFVGMIIGVPLFAVIYDVLKKLIIFGLNRHDHGKMLFDYHDDFGDPVEDTEAENAQAKQQSADESIKPPQE